MSNPFPDEPVEDNENEDEPSFAELLESYSAGVNDDIEVGDKITVTIISIGKDTVFVDTGAKIDGNVDKTELCDDNGEFSFEEGDSLELYVVSVSESEVRLSRAISGIGGLEMLQEAFAGEIPVEGRISETCKGGVRVEIMQRRAFCPISQIDSKFVETPETFVGQTFEFLITRFEENGRNIVVSRRKLLVREQRKIQEKFLAEIRNGDVLPGTITRIMPYGAFVEVAPGLEGMVHISELSWSRVQTAEEVVSVGDPVNARLLGVEKGDGTQRVKLALSMKQVQEDPWDRAAGKFAVGDRFNGKVIRCVDFGVFVEIAPGIEGLVHVSEMSYVKRVMRPEDMVTPGQVVAVVIKEFTPDQRRISLSMRDAEGDPWLDVPDKYTQGQRVRGTVEKHESFGIFVALEPGVTGLLHKSKISRAAKPAAIERLRAGDPIPVVVESIQAADRRISLNVGDTGEEDNWQEYTGGGGESMGSLGEQLQQALARKQKG